MIHDEEIQLTEVQLDALPCPRCGAPKDKQETIGPGFGGYWKRVCIQCGLEIRKGRKVYEEGPR